MNKIKSLSISLHWLILLLTAVVALFFWSQEVNLWLQSSLAWLAAPFITLMFVVKWLLLKLQLVDRDDERSVMTTTSALLGLAFVLLMDVERGLPLLLTALAAFNVFLYVYWSTSLSSRDKPSIEDGQTLIDQAGRTCFGPQLVVFLRGSWCVYSSAAARELADFVVNRVPESITVTVVSENKLGKLFRRCRAYQDRRLCWANDLGLALRGATPLPFNWLEGSDALLPGMIYINRDSKVGFQEWAESSRLPLNLNQPSPRLLKLIDAEWDGLR